MFLVNFATEMLAVSRDANNVFILPTAPGPATNFVANLQWELGSTVDVQWTTTASAYHIELYQQEIDVAHATTKGTIMTTTDGSGEQSFPWDVTTLGSSLDVSPVYFLWLFPKNDDADSFTSHYFNITQAQVVSTSSASAIVATVSPSKSSSSSTTSPTSSIATTSISMVVPSSSSVPLILPSSWQTGSTSNSPSSQSGSTEASPTSSSTYTPVTSSSSQETRSDSTALKVGLGVGLGIGIPLVLIAGIWIGLVAVRQRRPRSRDSVKQSPLSQYDAKQPAYYETPWQQPVQQQIHEADPERPPVELDSTQRTIS